MVGLVLKVRVLPPSLASTNHSGGEELHDNLQSRQPQAERENHFSPFLLKRIPKPEQLRLVDIVPEILARWAILHPEEPELKIRKIYDDADPGTDIYDELSLAEIFVDGGKARHDHGCDQRATIQIIPWPSNSVGAVRPGSVVQDYHRIAKPGRQANTQVSSRLRRLSIVSEAEERGCESIRPESARQSPRIPLPTVEPNNSVAIPSNVAIFPNSPPASQDSCTSVNEAVRLRGPDVYSGEELLRKRKRQQTPGPEQFTKRSRLQEDVTNWRRSPRSSPMFHDESDDEDDGSQPENDYPRFRDPFQPESFAHELSRTGETGSELDRVGSDVDSPIILFSSRESSPAPLPDSNPAQEGSSSDSADDDSVIEISSASTQSPSKQRDPSPENYYLNGVNYPGKPSKIQRLRKRANKEKRERIDIAESLNDKNLDPRLRRIYRNMSTALQRLSGQQSKISRRDLKRLRKDLKAVKSTIASEVNGSFSPLAQSSVEATQCSRMSSIKMENSALPSPAREAVCPSSSVPPVELDDQSRSSSSYHSMSSSKPSSPKVKIHYSPYKSRVQLTPQSSPGQGQESRIGSTIQEEINSYLEREEGQLAFLRFQRAPRRLSIESEGSNSSSGSSADSIDDSGDDSTYQ
ncbi:uncharacterized protein N7459_005555 [Penicillium hispanicum]|uniref:uncharacterized protein n=1 Tax=Penicillium hispanicum TaxID=1080232 RepID=UPI002540A901|nr:uncharacterized protein N7459_005555 [Penicillium hispanicum]KAJ5579570.1 hypothetical protein N7459_005555 [Penicillium hispanicum]